MKEYIVSEDSYEYEMRRYDELKELIRCKDCKYNNGGRCSWHSGNDYTWIVDDDDYCSCAERKEE